MLRIALTGGIATGKSYVAARLASAGIPVIDSDALVHDALANDPPTIAAVTARFGSVASAGGAIDRTALGAIVFADPQARADLEAILHPRVYRWIDEWFAKLADTPGDIGPSARPVVDDAGSPTPDGARPSCAVADIPLLYETGHQAFFDRVLVVACSPAQQIERMKRRNGLSDEQARLRLAAQWPIEEKMRRADFVVDTSGTFAETDRQVDRVVGLLRES